MGTSVPAGPIEGRRAIGSGVVMSASAEELPAGTAQPLGAVEGFAAMR